jgi:hypothetical protein
MLNTCVTQRRLDMTASKWESMLGVDDVFEKVKTELMSWPGVTSQPHRFGRTEFRVRGREMGHMHGGRWADLPFPMSIRNELVKDGRALPHHVLPNSGWVTYLINEDADVSSLINLFRMQYERLSGGNRKLVSMQQGTIIDQKKTVA